MKSGFFRNVFLLYIVVFILAILLAERYIAGVVRDSHIRNFEENLKAQALLIGPSVDFRNFPIDSRARTFKERTGARVTFIDRSGLVLGDSDADSSEMENHADRPEIQQAFIDGVGHSIRFSNTIKEDLLYTAVAVKKDGKTQGTVRLAVPLTEVHASIREIRVKIIAGVALVLFVTGLVSLLQVRRVQKLVRDVSGFSSSIAGGRFDERLMLKGLGEFEQIGGNLNLMARELQELIAKYREQYEQLNMIVKSVPDVLIILDAEDHIIMMNRAAEDFLGSHENMGRPVREVFREPDFISLLNRAREAGSMGETDLKLGDMGARYFHVKASPTDIAGAHGTGMVVLMHDITEARHVDQVRKDFVANVSHELKTPIAAIKGFADTLAEGAMDDKEHAGRFIEIIRGNSERMIKLVEDLLTLSRIELGVVKIEKQEVLLHDAVKKVMDDFRLQAGSKGISLKTELDSAVRTIDADRDRLMQILSNLIDNAVKYTDQGSVTVGAGLVRGRTFLSVSDTGIGISRAHVPRLGERFYRVDDSRSRALGGTGLGLAIVKHLVSAHGWDLRIESQPGSGTTVTITI